jgi:hypothetical protein|tara:strand:- start:341 stop:1183 length:843 start_codon:yes stop_codon:yes gene_type:complete
MRHKKYKNTGIIFELLTRQIVSDVLDGDDNSNATKLVSKYFRNNSELRRELLLYKSLSNTKFSNESKANKFIDIVISEWKKLNKSELRRQKYNLIKDLKETYTVSFFKTKIDNYKLNASIYRTFDDNFTTPVDKINTRYTIVENIVESSQVNVSKQDSVISEYEKQDKDLRLLSYNILLEKFNDKYGGLDKNQKTLLRQYINNISDTPKLKDYINRQSKVIIGGLLEHIPNVSDNVVQIKLKEVVNQFKAVIDDTTVRDKHIVSLLKGYELVKELKNEKS